MSTFKFKMRDGWTTLYGGILSRVLRKDYNLSDLADKITARANLELNGDNNTTHYHDSRYIPLINAALSEAQAYTDTKVNAAKSELTQSINSLDTRLTNLNNSSTTQIAAIQTDISTQIAAAKAYTDQKVSAHTTATNSSITSLQTEINNLKSRMTALEAKASTNQTNIANIQSQIQGLPKIYVQSATPSSPPANAVWIRSGNPCYISIYVSNAWKNVGAVWN